MILYLFEWGKQNSVELNNANKPFHQQGRYVCSYTVINAFRISERVTPTKGHTPIKM